MKRESLNKKNILALIGVGISFIVAALVMYFVYVPKEASQPAKTPEGIQAESYPVNSDAKEVEEIIVPEPVPRTDAKILVFGDTAFLEPISYLIDDPEFDPLANVSEKFHEYDYVVGNHEATIDGTSVGTSQEGKPYTFSTPKASVNYFKNAGIDAFSYANNHAKDYGPASVNHTIELLNSVGIATYGAGSNSAEAFKPLITEVNGNKLAFLSYNCAEYAFNWANGSEAGTAYYNESLVRNSIQNAKSQADVVIVTPHCGTEHVTIPDDIQIKWAKIFTSAGADFVIGSHPHVRQQPEVVNGVTVVYSVGNFMFPGQSWNPEAQKGWAVELIIEDKQIQSYSLIETQMDENGVPSWADSL